MSKKVLYFVIGPTASGKTALSINLAKDLGSSEIISADSRQIYKDFNLSSGKVTKEEMSGIPHHMLDIVDPGQYFSVVDFTNMALRKIAEVYVRGNTPIVCGGTGFYIDSLLYDYQLPDVVKNDGLRQVLDSKTTNQLFSILKVKLIFNLKNYKYMFSNLKTLKKFSHPEFKNNPHRIIRAIEIVESLGYIPKLRKVERFNQDDYELKIINIQVDKSILKDKIYKRLIQRIDEGMIEEILKTKDKYNLSFEYLESLGLEFKNVAKYLRGEFTKEEMTEKLYLEICQYAKRQVAWFKRYNK